MNRFLLQRPFLDLTDVPLLYSLLNSGDGSRYKQERSWMLRLLCFGLRAKPDHMVFRRRHVYELLMSFYDASYADTFTRKVILQLFVHALSIRACLVELTRDKGLLAWLQRNATRANAPLVLSEACASLMTVAISNFPLHSYPFLLPTFVAASSALLDHLLHLLTDRREQPNASPSAGAQQRAEAAGPQDEFSLSLMTQILSYAVLVARRSTEVDAFRAAAALPCGLAQKLFGAVTAVTSSEACDRPLREQSHRLLAELMMTVTASFAASGHAPSLSSSALERYTEHFRFLTDIVQWTVHLVVTDGSALADLSVCLAFGRYELSSTYTAAAVVSSHVRPIIVRILAAECFGLAHVEFVQKRAHLQPATSDTLLSRLLTWVLGEVVKARPVLPLLLATDCVMIGAPLVRQS